MWAARQRHVLVRSKLRRAQPEALFRSRLQHDGFAGRLNDEDSEQLEAEVPQKPELLVGALELRRGTRFCRRTCSDASASGRSVGRR